MDNINIIKEYSREPTIEDLVELCRNFNKHKVKYVVIGGFAVIHYGYVRGTMDIDILVDASVENIKKIKKALLYLPDKAVKEMRDDDLDVYNVVRVADEIIVDLLKQVGTIDYKEASKHIEYKEVDGVKIPYIGLELLLKTKMTYRAKDKDDRLHLEHILKERKKQR